MADRKPERAYDQQIEQSRLRGELEASRGGGERRRDVRVQPDASHVLVEDDPWVYLINVSKAGIAFFTDAAREPGTVLRVRMDDGPDAEAKVVQCEADVADPAAIAGQFRISAEFIDPAAGLQFFLALRELDVANLDIDSA